VRPPHLIINESTERIFKNGEFRKTSGGEFPLAELMGPNQESGSAMTVPTTQLASLCFFSFEFSRKGCELAKEGLGSNLVAHVGCGFSPRIGETLPQS
jgi:hypothetical protein